MSNYSRSSVMSNVDKYRVLLEKREKELAETDRRITTAPTEKAAKYLRNKSAGLRAEIDAINKTLASQTPKGAA